MMPLNVFQECCAEKGSWYQWCRLTDWGAKLQRVSITSRWRPKSFVFYILISESLEQQQEWLVGILVPKTYLTEMLEHSSGLLNATHSSQTRPVYKSHAWNLQKRWTLWKPRARKHIFFQVFFFKVKWVDVCPIFHICMRPSQHAPWFQLQKERENWISVLLSPSKVSSELITGMSFCVIYLPIKCGERSHTSSSLWAAFSAPFPWI